MKIGESGLNRQNNRELLPWLLCLVFIAIVPIIILRDFTPANELRYLSIADESLASGRWWAFTNHGIPYADKPPLYLWCIMVGKFLLGSHYMWFYSLFSIIPAFVIAIVMDRWMGETLPSRFRTAATLMLFSCGLYAGMLFTLRMDMMMTMFIVLALHQFAKLVSAGERPSLRQRLLFALWIFLAVFTKGPMGILIPLAATAAWLFATHRIRLFGRAWGWPTWLFLIILCAAWFAAVFAEGGKEYLDNLLVHQTVGRAVNSFHHKRPVWYYLISLTYTLLPWTFLIFGAFVYGIRNFRKQLKLETEGFFLVIVLTSFVLLSLISSKLQVYMLPAYPFMVYYCVAVCSKFSGSRLTAIGIAIPNALLAIAGVGVAALCLNLKSDSRNLWMPAAAVVLIVGTTLVFRWLYVRPRIACAISALSSTVLALVFVGGFAMADFNSDMGYGKIADKAEDISNLNSNAEIVVWKLDRPENMDVYLHGKQFKIAEASDTATCMPLQSFPAVVVTETQYRNEVPFVIAETKVGRKFAVLLCDTTHTDRKEL